MWIDWKNDNNNTAYTYAVLATAPQWLVFRFWSPSKNTSQTSKPNYLQWHWHGIHFSHGQFFYDKQPIIAHHPTEQQNYSCRKKHSANKNDFELKLWKWPICLTNAWIQMLCFFLQCRYLNTALNVVLVCNVSSTVSKNVFTTHSKLQCPAAVCITVWPLTDFHPARHYHDWLTLTFKTLGIDYNLFF